MTTPTTIHLLKPHHHGGRDYPAGAALTLPQRKAAWLIGIGVATAAVSSPAAAVGAPLAGARARGAGKRAPTRGAPTDESIKDTTD